MQTWTLFNPVLMLTSNNNYTVLYSSQPLMLVFRFIQAFLSNWKPFKLLVLSLTGSKRKQVVTTLLNTLLVCQKYLFMSKTYFFLSTSSSLYLVRISSRLEMSWLKVSRSMTRHVTPSGSSATMFAVRRSSLKNINVLTLQNDGLNNCLARLE